MSDLLKTKNFDIFIFLIRLEKNKLISETNNMYFVPENVNHLKGIGIALYWEGNIIPQNQSRTKQRPKNSPMANLNRNVLSLNR